MTPPVYNIGALAVKSNCVGGRINEPWEAAGRRLCSRRIEHATNQGKLAAVCGRHAAPLPKIPLNFGHGANRIDRHHLCRIWDQIPGRSARIGVGKIVGVNRYCHPGSTLPRIWQRSCWSAQWNWRGNTSEPDLPDIACQQPLVEQIVVEVGAEQTCRLLSVRGQVPRRNPPKSG